MQISPQLAPAGLPSDDDDDEPSTPLSPVTEDGVPAILFDELADPLVVLRRVVRQTVSVLHAQSARIRHALPSHIRATTEPLLAAVNDLALALTAATMLSSQQQAPAKSTATADRAPLRSLVNSMSSGLTVRSADSDGPAADGVEGWAAVRPEPHDGEPALHCDTFMTQLVGVIMPLFLVLTGGR